MKFNYKRLISIREQLGINKAEAARRLNMSAMGYGRYEKGEREPSFQTVSYIAESFGTTTDYLYSLSDNPYASTITISASEDQELFMLIEHMRNDSDFADRVFEYTRTLDTL